MVASSLPCHSVLPLCRFPAVRPLPLLVAVAPLCLPPRPRVRWPSAGACSGPDEHRPCRTIAPGRAPPRRPAPAHLWRRERRGLLVLGRRPVDPPGARPRPELRSHLPHAPVRPQADVSPRSRAVRGRRPAPSSCPAIKTSSTPAHTSAALSARRARINRRATSGLFTRATTSSQSDRGPVTHRSPRDRTNELNEPLAPRIALRLPTRTRSVRATGVALLDGREGSRPRRRKDEQELRQCDPYLLARRHDRQAGVENVLCVHQNRQQVGRGSERPGRYTDDALSPARAKRKRQSSRRTS